MKRLIASFAVLSLAATPALAVTNASTPAPKTVKADPKSQMKADKAAKKAADKSAKLAAKNNKKTN